MPNILVVDDEFRIRQIIRKYAEFEGYGVEEAVDGMQAIEICRKNQFDLIIMDVMMPELDGFSACREIRKFCDTPIIMLSARGEEYDKIHGFELGSDDYVVKPFSPKELMMRVGAVIKRSNSSSKQENTERDVFIIRAVPDTDDQEDDQGCKRRRQHLGDMRAGFGLAELGAAHLLARVEERRADCQRVEDIVLHPRAERDMPSAPIFVDGLREVRTLEVVDQIDAEELRHTAGDINTAREVGVQLERIEQDGEGQRRAGILIVALRGRSDGIDRHDRSVGDDQLLEEAP